MKGLSFSDSELYCIESAMKEFRASTMAIQGMDEFVIDEIDEIDEILEKIKFSIKERNGISDALMIISTCGQYYIK